MSASSTTQHCVTLSTSEVEYVAMTHGEKTALTIKVVRILFSHISVVGPLICTRITRGQRCCLKTPGFSPQQPHRRALLFLAGACEVGAGNNSQCSLGGTTCGHSYEATRARGVPEAP